MSRAGSLAGAGEHEVRRIARTLLRTMRELALHAELDAAHLALERSGPWDVRLFLLDAPDAGGRVCFHGHGAPHWLLAVRARDERARWEHLPALLRALRLPAGTHPLVAPADTPAGEPVWWLWRPNPNEARARNAPSKPGAEAWPDAHASIRGAVERTHAELRAREADQAAARAAAEERARLDVEEATRTFRPASVASPWSGGLPHRTGGFAHPVPVGDDRDACSACGVPTWDDCGFELVTLVGPGRWRPGATRESDEDVRLCPDCLADTSKLLAELYTRNGAGCCLHVVADDNNLDDESVAYVKGHARDRGHTFCELLADRYAAADLSARRALNGLPPEGVEPVEPPPEIARAPQPRPARRVGGGGAALLMLLALGALGSPGPDDPR